MNSNLEKINMFFSYNIKIKQIMYDMAPNEEYMHNDEDTIKYVDKVFKNLNILEFLLGDIVTFFGNQDELEKSNIILKKCRHDFMNANVNISELKNAYKNNISDMNPEFIKSVNENCKGYYLFMGSNIKQAKTINELLHYWHMMLVNNENIYQKMPKILSKTNNNGTVNLYGNNDQLAETIYNSMATSISRQIDILSLNDRILIMMRDLGHATMIEITSKNDSVIVSYFIPKVCNDEMILKLKGISNFKAGNKYARGIFEIGKEDLVQNINELVSKIPTDDDMFIEEINQTPKTR